MPHSRPDARPWVTRQIRRLKPRTILDVGAGAGTYWDLLSGQVSARWTAVEIFEPYVARFGLSGKYDRVIVGDFLELDLDAHDVVILGDVLEHVSRDRAALMWDKARSLGTTICVLPLDRFAQGAVNGNIHEAHLHHWTHEEVLSLGGVRRHWTGVRKGAYLVDP